MVTRSPVQSRPMTRPLGDQALLVDDHVEHERRPVPGPHGVVARLELPRHHQADPLVGDPRRDERVGPLEVAQHQPHQVRRDPLAARHGGGVLTGSGGHPPRLVSAGWSRTTRPGAADAAGRTPPSSSASRSSSPGSASPPTGSDWPRWPPASSRSACSARAGGRGAGCSWTGCRSRRCCWSTTTAAGSRRPTATSRWRPATTRRTTCTTRWACRYRCARRSTSTSGSPTS